MRLFYFAATNTMKLLLVALTRWRVDGKDNVPRRGPLIVASNHLSIIDPPLLGASVPRRITFMAKQELFGPPMVRLIVQAYGAFPVRRGEIDREALRSALESLQNGCALGMFPEGKRSPDTRLQSAQPGVSLIAARSGVPILPVAICGSEHVEGLSVIVRRPRITVTIGRPFSLPSVGGKPTRANLAEYSDLIMEHIAELLPPGYRPASSGSSVSRSVNGD